MARPHGTKKIETPEKMWELFEAYRKCTQDLTIDGFQKFCKNTICHVSQYFPLNNYKEFNDVICSIKNEIFQSKLELYKKGELHHQKICREASERNVDISNTPFFIGKTSKNQFIIENGLISVKNSALRKKTHTAKSIKNIKPPDTIYVLNIEGTNIYKIGTSQKVDRRIKDIRASNPFHIDVLFIGKLLFAYEVEQSIHEMLEKHHIKNEWFKIKDINSVIKMIKNV